VPDENTPDAAESATEDIEGLFRRSSPFACGIESSELSSETSGTSGRALSFRDRMLRVIEDSENGRLLPEGRDWRGWENSSTVERMAVVISSREV
jgi:hypothetical protein